MSPADLRWCAVTARATDTLRAADATPTPIRSQKLPDTLRYKHIIIACLNSVAGVNPAVLIDRAERGLRKMVAVRAEIIAPT